MRKVISKMQLFRDKIRRKIGILLFDKKVVHNEFSKVENILIIRWDAKLGDSYISSFFFREIKKRTNTQVTVLTTPELRSLYMEGFGVDRVMVVNKRPKYRELKEIARKLGKIDLVVHLTEHMKLKDLYFLSLINAPNIASMDDAVGRVNIKMSARTGNMLFHDKYVYILKLLAVPDIDEDYIIPYNVSIDERQTGYPLLCNFFGSTEHKSVSVERAVTSLKLIKKSHPELAIGILYSPSTIEKAKKIVADVNYSDVQLIEDIITIDDAINCIAKSGIILSVDTSIVHIATGLKKQTIAIYPKRKDIFNSWLPPKSDLTSIIFSQCAGIDVDVNNYSDDELVLYIHEKINS